MLKQTKQASGVQRVRQVGQWEPRLLVVSVYRLVSELTGVNEQGWGSSSGPLGSAAQSLTTHVLSCGVPATPQGQP